MLCAYAGNAKALAALAVRYKSGAGAVDADENVYEEDEIDRLIASLADDDLSRQSKLETQDALRGAARAETRWSSGSDNSASACDAGA